MNYGYIVNLNRIRLYNSVSLKYGPPTGSKKSERFFMNEKKFDAVKMMRDIRDRLSMKYAENPDAEERDLEKIRERFSAAVGQY